MNELVDMVKSQSYFEVSPFRGCDAVIADAFIAASGRLTPQHSATANRLSIWNVFKDTLDAPVATNIQRINWVLPEPILDGFLPSSMWRVTPKVSIARRDSLNDRNVVFLPRTLDDLFSGRSYTQSDNLESQEGPSDKVTSIAVSQGKWATSHHNFGKLLEISANLDRWRDLLVESAMLLPKRNHAARISTLRSTLDSLIVFIDAIQNKYIRCRFADRQNGAPVHLQEPTYCRLCWRPTERQHFYDKGKVDGDSGETLNSKFCALHNPVNGNAIYRRDIKYFRAFNEQIDAYESGDKSGIRRFLPPATWHHQDVRKAAYYAARARLDMSDQSIWCLYCVQRFTQAEIASKLNISRQAVSKSLNSYVERLNSIRQKLEDND